MAVMACLQAAELVTETELRAGFLLQITCQKHTRASNTCQLPEDWAALLLSIPLPSSVDVCSAEDLGTALIFHVIVLPQVAERRAVFVCVSALELG